MKTTLLAIGCLVLSLSAQATDPARLWGKYTGGGSTDFIRASITDDNGNIYVTGFTETLGLATASAHQINHGGFRDSYLSKYDINGVLQWTTYLGGSSEDRGTSLAVLPGSNKVVISGYTNSTNNISTTGAHQTNYGGGSNDCFLSCFSPTGTLLWSTYFGGTGKDEPYAVTTNSYGDIFMTGVTVSSTAISTTQVFDSTYNGGEDGFLARFTENGVLVWSTYLGGTGSETMYASVTADSLVWVAGKTTSLELASPVAYQAAKGNGTDGILYTFHRNGTRYWSTYFGGNGEDIIWGLGYSDGFGNLFPSGKVYLSGQTTSDSAIATQGAHQTTYAGGTDALVASFTRNGGIQWATYIGGPGLDMSYGMAFNSTTDLLVTGGTQSTTGISTPGAFQTSLGGSDDAFLIRFDPNGQRIWGTYYGGFASDWGYNVSCDPEGNIFLAGYTQSNNQVSFPTTSSFGGFDGLLVKLFECPENFVVSQPVDTSSIVGGTVTFEVVPTVSVLYRWQVDNGTGFTNITNAGPFSGVTTRILTVSNITQAMDNYKFRCLLINNQCTDTTEMANLSISTVGVQTLQNKSLKLYPNPNHGNFYISDLTSEPYASITIYDLSGRLLYHFTNQNNPANLLLPELKTGIYLVESKSKAGIGMNRLMIEK